MEFLKAVAYWSRNGTAGDAIARLYAIGAGNTARAMEAWIARVPA